MKKIFLTAICFAIALPILSCKSLQDNLNARKNLQKCKYEFVKLDPGSVQLKGMKLNTVSFDAIFQISNRASTDVIMDKMEGTVLINDKETATFSHDRVLKIKKGQVAREPISISIPFMTTIKSLGSMPKYLTLDVTFYMNLMVGQYKLGGDIPINIKIRKKIPYKKIQKMAVKAARKSIGGSWNNLFQ